MNPAYHIEQIDNPTPDTINHVKDGIREFNQQHGYTDITPIAVLLRDSAQNIIGGVYGELGLNWLYVDLLWVGDAHKKQGHGRQLMHCIEQYALEQGVANIHLATTSFQALPFYYHIGYRLFGKIEDRPQGYNYYYLQKKIETTSHKNTALNAIINPAGNDIRAIAQGLRQHNLNKGISSKSHKVCIVLKDDNGVILGGLLGAIYWDWLDLQTFWIHESLRHQGYGTKMLKLAEDMAQKHNAPHIILDVIDFQGLPFFGRHGFMTIATLPDRPEDHITYFLTKHL